MEKKLYELKIDEEFRAMIPELSESEEAMLTASILEEGCTSPIIVWNGVIIDGHHRYAICREFDIPFAIEEKDFESRDEAVEWISVNQLGRRNLSQYSKCELALRFEPTLQKEAKKRQGRRTDLMGDKLDTDSRRFSRTRDILANMAGVSNGQIQKAKTIMLNADEETKRRLRKGDISIHFAYSTLMQKSSEECLEDRAQGVDRRIRTNDTPVKRTVEISNRQSIESEGIEMIKKELGILANEILIGNMDRSLMLRSIEKIGDAIRVIQ